MDFEVSVFGVGLGLGLLVALSVWINKWRAGSSMRKEMDELKKHLQTQMSITAKGYEEVHQELARLKQENENLRITIATLSNKPGKTELRTLHVWDKALRIMKVTSPGFAPAWEMAVAEASKEVQEVDTGVKALVRRVFPMLPQDINSNNPDEL